MSHRLINHSVDLKKLRDDGYDISVILGHLVLDNVPYVNAQKEILRGKLVSTLMLNNDVTIKPETHVVHFAGQCPCDLNGNPLHKVVLNSNRREFGPNLWIDYDFSSKPLIGYYENYYEKMSTYAQILSCHAQAIDPNVTARIFPVIETQEDEAVFNYIDTASSRAGISAITNKLQLGKIAIIGLGGTGSYVLDLVAKTPVKEIHLFDGDTFLQHNAFRSPGAPSRNLLNEKLSKPIYFGRIYSNMHRGIISHEAYIDETNVNQLHDMDFVFLCLDRGDVKKLIVETLQHYSIPFIEVGLGVYQTDDALGGIVRVTSSTPDHCDQILANNRIPFSSGNGNNEYDRNIQIADLNALNASLAVIKWKKLFGFYSDIDREHFCTYTIDGNILTNEDKP
ncbi:UBA/THIF-type NAD/FAD binding fold protein [uncultured Sporomusa sp.]|uniref:UBA/THIF-type NAD/FAD binding fold protein n=1 Tax=uncultured Sporomusa sp. TaxID=307249 RepID=A0A212LXW5_9FIRM|nr:ThiF family adenylyltransferase [uncultured Sporomusa sp.]SCM82320.1 UBA/THIF-type NAD/FAD binding fold protein [uncultured Sporomusa sp.]